MVTCILINGGFVSPIDNARPLSDAPRVERASDRIYPILERMPDSEVFFTVRLSAVSILAKGAAK